MTSALATAGHEGFSREEQIAQFVRKYPDLVTVELRQIQGGAPTHLVTKYTAKQVKDDNFESLVCDETARDAEATGTRAYVLIAMNTKGKQLGRVGLAFDGTSDEFVREGLLGMAVRGQGDATKFAMNALAVAQKSLESANATLQKENDRLRARNTELEVRESANADQWRENHRAQVERDLNVAQQQADAKMQTKIFDGIEKLLAHGMEIYKQNKTEKTLASYVLSLDPDMVIAFVEVLPPDKRPGLVAWYKQAKIEEAKEKQKKQLANGTAAPTPPKETPPS